MPNSGTYTRHTLKFRPETICCKILTNHNWESKANCINFHDLGLFCQPDDIHQSLATNSNPPPHPFFQKVQNFCSYNYRYYSRPTWNQDTWTLGTVISVTISNNMICLSNVNIPKSYFTFGRGDLKFVDFITSNINSIGLKEHNFQKGFIRLQGLDGVLPSVTNRTWHGRYRASYRGF